MAKHTDSETLLDRAVAQIAETQPDAEVAEAAAARVWSRLGAADAHLAAGAAEVEHIRGYDDYVALIPAYLADALPAARRTLVEEYARESVPFRRALNAARDGRPLEMPKQPPAAATSSPQRSVSYGRWALAATLVAGLGLAYLMFSEMWPGYETEATVETVAGDLYRVSEASHLPIGEGDTVREGEIIRAGREGGAVLRLADGSLVELRQRSEVRIQENRRGTTVELERGSVIVQAAKQRERHLYVATEDCLVSVTGTVFSVDHGTKGSRVSVIEGEVRVSHAGEEAVLEPGQQLATHDNLDPVPLAQQYSWGRDLDTYITLMEEITSLRDEIRNTVPRPGLRYSSRLLDLMPEGTLFYAAVPNLGETVKETHRLVEERVASSPQLSEWWEGHGSQQFQETLAQVVDGFGEFGEYLGSELAVGGNRNGGEFHGPLVLAEVVDEAGLRDFVARQMDAWEIDGSDVIVVDDLSQVGASDDALYLLVRDGVLVGSPDAESMTQVVSFLDGASNAFIGSPFYDSIAELYGEGAEILIAADLESLVDGVLEEDNSAEAARGLQALGLDTARHLVAEQKSQDDLTSHRVSVGFSEARQGMASWLAEPAPMGALDFISADARFVMAFVVEDPVTLFDEMRSLSEDDGFIEILNLFREEHGIDLRDDFVASLGGELAVAIDGPLLPEVSWKLVFEVYDTARFQWSLEQGLVELNQRLAEEGEAPVELLHEVVGDRSFYTLPVAEKEFHYTFVEGYLVAAPNRALLDRAIRYRDSGFSITDQERFNALMPADGRNNFSALVYQDLSEVMQTVAEQMADSEGVSPEQQAALDAMKAESSPTLGYAYAEDTRITFAAVHRGDVLGSLLMRVFGVGNPMGIGELLSGDLLDL